MEELTTLTRWFGPAAPAGSGGIWKKPVSEAFSSKLMASYEALSPGAPGDGWPLMVSSGPTGRTACEIPLKVLLLF